MKNKGKGGFVNYRNVKQKRHYKKVYRGLSPIIITVAATLLFIFVAIKLCQAIFPQTGYNGFVPTAMGQKVSEKVKKAQGLEIPDWIDSQIIKIHSTARSGAQLWDINNIVVHYIGNPNSSAQNNRDYFNKSSTEVSSHFIVGLKGEIIQCVPLWEKSAASNDRNGDTISIEVCHKDESGKFSKKTYKALIKLISWLCYEFDLDETQVIRHYDITEKNCPKYYVENPKEWKQLKKDVKEGIDSYEDKR